MLASALYDRVCEPYDIRKGKELSTRERDAKGFVASTLVYGEIHFRPYAITFQKIRQLYGGLARSGGTFVDVGSGTGKPVFAAALLHDFAECRGVEVLTGLHDASLKLLERWRSDEIQAQLSPAQRGTNVSFVLGDARRVDWSDADCIFMNSTCFDEPLMLELAAVANAMRKDSFCITFTKRLPSAKWEVLEHEVHSMTWGKQVESLPCFGTPSPRTTAARQPDPFLFVSPTRFLALTAPRSSFRKKLLLDSCPLRCASNCDDAVLVGELST